MYLTPVHNSRNCNSWSAALKRLFHVESGAMPDLHEWLVAARSGAYESLVREYTGDLGDIPELTQTDVEEITDQIKEKVKKRKLVRRGVPGRRRAVAAWSADVRAPAQGILPCLSGFVISSAIVLRSS